MSDSPDAQLQLKKRARRRLVGAVAFAGLAAVILPMVMDEEPKQQVQDIQIRIPGQDSTAFNPKLRPETSAKQEPAPRNVDPTPSVAPPPLPVKPTENVAAPALEKPVVKPVEKKVEAVPLKPAEKLAEKAPTKTTEKPADKKTAETVTKAGNDDQRAADILSGKAENNSAAANGNGQFVILIGAFSNPANVQNLKTKLGEVGVKVYTESLDSPGGRKTRVRAGPFASRDAADKALAKMKRMGVNGVVATK